MNKIEENYEIVLVRYADGAMSAAEREETEAWLKEHPEAAEELALYCEAPRLEADEEVAYVGKKGLEHHATPLWRQVASAAAAVAAVVLLMTTANQTEKYQGIETAKLDPAETRISQPQTEAQEQIPATIHNHRDNETARASNVEGVKSSMLVADLPEPATEMVLKTAESQYREVTNLIVMDEETEPQENYAGRLIETESEGLIEMEPLKWYEDPRGYLAMQVEELTPQLVRTLTGK